MIPYFFPKENKGVKVWNHNENSDIDGLDLFSELKILREIVQVENDTPVDIHKYIIRLGSFPNVFIVYRIMLTILVTDISTERSFSKLKLIKFNFFFFASSED